MKSLAKQFIDKECLIYLMESMSNIQGVIKEISDTGMLVTDTSGATQIINLDYVTRISEIPTNKKGKKKKVILD